MKWFWAVLFTIAGISGIYTITTSDMGVWDMFFIAFFFLSGIIRGIEYSFRD